MSEKKVNKLAAEDDDFKRVHRSNLDARLSFLKTDALIDGGEPPNQKPESYTGFAKKGIASWADVRGHAQAPQQGFKRRTQERNGGLRLVVSQGLLQRMPLGCGR